MPPAPTLRMRTLARRWLTDTVELASVSYATDTRPLGKAATTTSDPVTVSALIRQQVVDLTDTQTARRDVREFVVWLDETGIGTDPDQLTADDGTTILTADDAVTILTADPGSQETVDVDPVAGQRLTITACGDPSLVGKFGEVTAVDRDAIRAVRRLTVRLANDD